jgi:hypothetical protein
MLTLPSCKVDFDYDAKADPDRKLADWVFSKDGKVSLAGATEDVPDGRTFPAGPLFLNRVVLQTDYEVTDEDVDLLSQASGVTTFIFRNTRLSNNGLEKWSRSPGAAQVAVLFVNSDRVTDAGLAHLARFESLKQLYLGRAKFSPMGLEGLRNLKNLDTLLLYGSNLDDHGAKVLASFPALTNLVLSFTGITDKGLAVLAGCKNLAQLDVRGTTVTEPGVKQLKAALPNCRVVSDFDKP